MPHLKSAVDYLDELGATDVNVIQRNHLRISWNAAGRAMNITLSSTPSCNEDCAQVARQLIRRRYREAGVECRSATSGQSLMRPSWSRDRRPSPFESHALILGTLPYFLGVLVALCAIAWFDVR